MSDIQSVAVGHRIYLSVGTKFLLAQLGAVSWTGISLVIALPWMYDLSSDVGWPLTIFSVFGIGIIPGYISAFVLFSLLQDKRPSIQDVEEYPAITVLVAAYNEEKSIGDTLGSMLLQNYPGELEIIVIDDGSQDRTAAIVERLPDSRIRLLSMPRNGGKAAALNAGLAESSNNLILTIDADTYLYRDAMKLIVGRYLSDPVGTVAVAGAIGVRNSRKNWVTKLQEWDYFHGISIVKRAQSLYQGTLVAQGAFSLYEREAIKQVGGWSTCVGEDIVLSWAFLARGWRIGFAENAVVFTNVPESYKQLFQQRRRWARGMFEALRAHPNILIKRRLSLMFVIANLFFPWTDLAYAVCFVPGLVAALFGYYLLVGPITLFLLPLAIINNFFCFKIQSGMFSERGLRVRENKLGFILYSGLGQVLLSPASLAGYFSEIFQFAKNWGTK